MPKTLNFELTNEDLAEIVQAIKHDKRPEVRQRAIGLRLMHQGQTPKEVAEINSVSQPTVYDKEVGQKWQFAKRHFLRLYTHRCLRIVQASLLSAKPFMFLPHLIGNTTIT